MDEPASNPSAPVAVVTGAAGGIGGPMAQHFAAHGWRLALLERPHNQQRLAERFPNAVRVAADLTDGDATTLAMEQVIERHGRIDALLNVVGAFAMQSALSASDADLERQLALNLATAFHATRAVLTGMVERGSGFILGVAAAAAVRGGARTPAYGAAKSALSGYLRSVRAEVEPKGVGVALLVPMGAVDTPRNREAMPDADASGWIDPRELAAAALFLASRGARGRVRELRVYGSG